MITSSIRQRSSCLRSRSVVVGADHTRPRSAPSASSRSRSGAVSVRGSLLFAQRELGLGLGELAECVLPVALQAAGDEPVLGLDLAIAALRSVGLVSGALDLQPPLLQRGVVVLLERFGRLQRGLHAGGGERGQQRAGDGLVDLTAADSHAPFAAVLDEDAGGAVIGGALVPAAALIVDLELASAAAAHRDPLQQRAALADGAARLVRARAGVAGDPLAVCARTWPYR